MMATNKEIIQLFQLYYLLVHDLFGLFFFKDEKYRANFKSRIAIYMLKIAESEKSLRKCRSHCGFEQWINTPDSSQGGNAITLHISL